MVHTSLVLERPCTRAFTARMKRNRGTDSTESPDDLQCLRKASFDCFDARTNFSEAPIGKDALQNEIKAEKTGSSPKKFYRSDAPSPEESPVSPRTIPRVRSGSSVWKKEAVQADAEFSPMSPDGTGLRLQVPLTPDYYQLFHLDPNIPSANLWAYFHWISDKASSAIESIITTRKPLTEDECRELEIMVLEKPSEQLHYCNVLLAQANYASTHLLWYRKRYDSTYRLVRAENEKYAYALWNATGNKTWFRTIWERIECDIAGEEMAHREPLKDRPINWHRLQYADNDEEVARRQSYQGPAKVEQKEELVDWEIVDGSPDAVGT